MAHPLTLLRLFVLQSRIIHLNLKQHGRHTQNVLVEIQRLQPSKPESPPERRVKPEDMLAGVKRYAIYCQTTGNTGTQYVRQAATFFGPDSHFEESRQTPSAPGGGRRNVLPVSGFSEQDYGESGCQW